MIKQCPSFPGYSATDDCRIISHRRRGKGKQRGTYLGGSNHPGSKLTGGQAAQIRRRRRCGEKVKDLAADFQVSTSTIESIIYGRSYKPAAVEFKRIEGGAA